MNYLLIEKSLSQPIQMKNNNTNFFIFKKINNQLVPTVLPKTTPTPIITNQLNPCCIKKITQKKTQSVNVQNKRTCSICGLQTSTLYSLECGHIMCSACFKIWKEEMGCNYCAECGVEIQKLFKI
ncbi:hypothetical protein EHI8A_228470 [Entamoeba histolytica HM-1:IMSS-B]|uniref:RING-type domain-containing protein n=6 Tax=Entamoeba histolytica TaxID=5759 RepID=C4LX45_ENTH1|nr:hypothetical protein EHI_159650 [Entamoeba histolytica HM-1:IMSS]EMD42850.1 Hypothetical protein EHI5A_072450 [Entamoeba histolytica KU27]EMH73245.1 hypothetical protein EHI8A_228470 [Entamoeba histolytica HM-1:IMSS-B]EMS14618.1 hypothetical protein KM1_133290 [Entamoeba histolytica HM-3:IMSS]ENY62968.1 hypothetical protein EHI7A_190740 [Entamoeba histolytica HM-1:IMSS-A]GAT93300.1 hypothetical protein CL6EHI_159650 [Entamoeba histolytica]|eukprot:XP_650243.1 hypothetical protein EHI_159650 [Entamoeba histolytica HM-1:IMSS]